MAFGYGRKEKPNEFVEGGYDEWPGTTTVDTAGVPDKVWTNPPPTDPGTVAVGTDPLSVGTDEALGGIYEEPLGDYATAAGDVASGLLETGGDVGGYTPHTEAGQAGRTALTEVIDTGGGDPDAFRTDLGTTVQDELGGVIGDEGYMAANPITGQVQGALGTVIGEEGRRTAHEATQQAQQQYDELIRLGAQRPLSPSEQAMVTALQTIIQQGGMPAESLIGTQTGEQIAYLLANQGRLPPDLQREAMQIEAARSPLDVLRRAQTAQGAASLADRGLVGSGAGREYLEGLEERLAPQYTQAAQQIEEQRRQADEQRYSQALNLGAQRAGQRESLQQQGLQSALGQAAQYGLGLGQQGQQQQQFAISGQQQIGAQQEQAEDQRFQNAIQQGQALGLSREEMQSSRLGQALQQAGTMSVQESNARQNRYIQGIMAAEGITEQEARRQDQRVQMAMQTATGLDAQRVQNLLNTATTVGGRQQIQGNLAARSLDQNMHWNQFLAQFGLDRTVAQHDIQNRRLDRILPLLEMYTRTMQGAGQGYTYYNPERTEWEDYLKNYANTQDVYDDQDNLGLGAEGIAPR